MNFDKYSFNAEHFHEEDAGRGGRFAADTAGNDPTGMLAAHWRIGA